MPATPFPHTHTHMPTQRTLHLYAPCTASSTTPLTSFFLRLLTPCNLLLTPYTSYSHTPSYFTPCTSYVIQSPYTSLHYALSYTIHSLHYTPPYTSLHYALLTPPSTGRAAAAGCPRKGARQRLPELAGKRPGRRPASVRRQAGRSVWDKPASVSGAARLLAREGCWQASRRLVGHAAQMLRERRFWRCCRQASRSKLAARLGRSYG